MRSQEDDAKGVEELTKKELRNVLTELGRSAAGSKTAMAERLAETLPAGAKIRLGEGNAVVAIADSKGEKISLDELRQPVQVELEPPTPVRDPAKSYPGAEIVHGSHDGRREGAQTVEAVPRGPAHGVSRKRPRPLAADGALAAALEGRRGCVVAVIGATGSGKTRLLAQTPKTAPHLSAQGCISWNPGQAIVSQFGTVEEASQWLLAVGLTSIPSWCKPHHILSTGERYRAVMARMLQQASQPDSDGVLVLDNFTSQLDRDTARACSAALAKQVRRLGLVCVVATGLADTVEWLAPEEIVCTDSGAPEARLRTARDGDFAGPRVRISISARLVVESLRAGEEVPEEGLRDASLPASQATRLRADFCHEEGSRAGEGGTVLVTKVATDDATLSCDRLFDNAFDGQCMLHIPGRQTVAPQAPFGLGVITGLSGSAKSVLLREHFGPPTRVEWADTHTVASHFATQQDAEARLGLVCLDADVHGERLFAELSMGEQELANLARMLDRSNVYLDEFTSALDRDLALRVARALAAHLARQEGPMGWVVVTCHADVLDILAGSAQWMYDTWRGRLELRAPASPEQPEGPTPDLVSVLRAQHVLRDDPDHARVLLQRPRVDLRLARCEPWLWALFRDHHYKTKSLSRKARCFVVFQEKTGTLVGFIAAIQQVGTPHASEAAGPAAGSAYTATWRAHRTVVLPSWQGLGIGSRLSDACAELHRRLACMYMAQTVHPRFGEYRDRSPLWEAAKWNHSTRAYKIETWKQRLENKRIKLRIPRFVYAHVYKGAADETSLLAAERVAFTA